jgi:RNA polymerase sigma factor (sigma-70 family)
MYNTRTMLSRSPSDQIDGLCPMDGVELFHICAANRENSAAWSEFLRRYSGKIKYFIAGTLRKYPESHALSSEFTVSGGVQESDLFQNIVVRLVENDCAVMKKFTGKSESDLLAYLAVICRSSVLDSLRRNRACKRRPATAAVRESFLASIGFQNPAAPPGFEREILVREIATLARKTISSHSGRVSGRDQLIFDLHFFDGLSCSQIAQCRGIQLSKAGVEKLLKRLVGRVQNMASSGKSEETLQ